MAKLQFSAQLTKVESRVDRTCKAILNTQELGEDAGKLMNLSGQQLNVLFVSADEAIAETDIPEAPLVEEDGGISPARRQRSKLYRIWEVNGKPGTFETYYRQRMSKNDDLLTAELERLTL